MKLEIGLLSVGAGSRRTNHSVMEATLRDENEKNGIIEVAAHFII